MRLLYIITGNDPVGGALIHLAEIAKFCVKKGDEVLVLIGENSEVSCKVLEDSGLNYKKINSLIRPIRPHKDLKAIVDVYREIKKFDPDIVLCHSSKAGIIGRIASKIANKIAIFTAHGWAFTEGINNFNRVFYAFIEKAMQYFSDKIITVSKYDFDLARRYGFDTNKMVVIYNGVEKKTPTISYSLIDSVLNDHKIIKVIMVARFNKPKNQALLIRSVVNFKNVHIIFIGDGELMNNCVNLVNMFGLSDRVHFLGYQKDVSYFLSKSDVFCLISNYEGFPLTTIEAMAHSLPVIVSDVGGAGEAVIDGFNGFKITVNSENKIEEKLSILIENEELRKRMGRNSYRLYKERYTKEIFCNSTYKLYQDLIQNLKINTFQSH